MTYRYILSSCCLYHLCHSCFYHLRQGARQCLHHASPSLPSAAGTHVFQSSMLGNVHSITDAQFEAMVQLQCAGNQILQPDSNFSHIQFCLDKPLMLKVATTLGASCSDGYHQAAPHSGDCPLPSQYQPMVCDWRTRRKNCCPPSPGCKHMRAA